MTHNVNTRVKIATQQRLKTTQFRTTCVLLKSDGLSFLLDNPNLTLKWFLKVVGRIEQNSEINIVITTLSRHRAPVTALKSDAA